MSTHWRELETFITFRPRQLGDSQTSCLETHPASRHPNTMAPQKILDGLVALVTGGGRGMPVIRETCSYTVHLLILT